MLVADAVLHLQPLAMCSSARDPCPRRSPHPSPPVSQNLYFCSARLSFPAGDTGSAISTQTDADSSTDQAAALSQAPPSPLSASAPPLRCTPNKAGNAKSATSAQGTTTGGGGGRAETDSGSRSSGSSSNNNGAMPGNSGGAATGAAQDGAASGGAGAPAVGGGRSLAPSPPAGPGPTAFASPAVTTAVVQQPLGHKV